MEGWKGDVLWIFHVSGCVYECYHFSSLFSLIGFNVISYLVFPVLLANIFIEIYIYLYTWTGGQALSNPIQGGVRALSCHIYSPSVTRACVSTMHPVVLFWSWALSFLHVLPYLIELVPLVQMSFDKWIYIYIYIKKNIYYQMKYAM